MYLCKEREGLCKAFFSKPYYTVFAHSQQYIKQGKVAFGFPDALGFNLQKPRPKDQMVGWTMEVVVQNIWRDKDSPL